MVAQLTNTQREILRLLGLNPKTYGHPQRLDRLPGKSTRDGTSDLRNAGD